jgi:hypothetical protein
MTEKQVEQLLNYRKDTRIFEGWLYAPVYSNYIGMRIRRFFKGFGASDGVIDSYLPAELNDGIPLWHVLHDDNDDEDLEFDDMIKSREYYLSDAKEGSDSEISENNNEEDEESPMRNINSTNTLAVNGSESKGRAIKRRRNPPSEANKPSSSSKKSASHNGSSSSSNRSSRRERSSHRIRGNSNYASISYNEDQLLSRGSPSSMLTSRASNTTSSSRSKLTFGKFGPYLNDRDDESEEIFDEDFLAPLVDQLPESERFSSIAEATSLFRVEDLAYSPTILSTRSADYEDQLSAIYREVKVQYQFLPGKIILANVMVNDRLSRTFVCCLPMEDTSSVSHNAIVPVYVPLFNQIIDLDINACYADIHDDEFFYCSYCSNNNLDHLRKVMKEHWLESLQLQWNYDLVVEVLSKRMTCKEEVLQSYYTSDLLKTHKSIHEFIQFYHNFFLPIRDGNMQHYTMLLRLFACADIVLNRKTSGSPILSYEGFMNELLAHVQLLVASSQLVVGITILVEGAGKAQAIGNISSFTAKYIDSLFDRGKHFDVYPVTKSSTEEPANIEDQAPQAAESTTETSLSASSSTSNGAAVMIASEAEQSATTTSSSSSSSSKSKRKSTSKIDLSNIDVDKHAVVQYDLITTKILRVYPDRFAASKAMKFTPAEILRACSHKSSSKQLVFGWRFDLVNDRRSSETEDGDYHSIRDLLMERYYDRLVEIYRKLNLTPGRAEDLDHISLRSDELSRIAVINLTCMRIVYHCRDHQSSSSFSWVTYEELLSVIRRPISDEVVQRCQTEWSQNIPKDVLEVIPEEEDVYLALQVAVERRLLHRSAMPMLYYQLATNGELSPLPPSAASTNLTGDREVTAKLATAIVQLVYMMHVDGIRPSTLCDHFQILYPRSIRSSSHRYTEDMKISCRSFEHALSLAVRLDHLAYDPSTNRLSITEAGLNNLFAVAADGGHDLQLADHLIEVLSKGYNHLVMQESTSYPVYAILSTNQSMLLIYHMKQLLIWASVEKVIHAVEAKKFMKADPSKSDAEVVRKLILEWHYSRAKDQMDKQSLVSKHLLRLYIQNLFQEAMNNARIRYDERTATYVAVSAAAASERVRELDSYEQHQLPATSSQATVEESAQNTNTVLIKMRMMRFMISEAILVRYRSDLVPCMSCCMIINADAA